MSTSYTVILADPPWRFGSRGARSGQYAELDYPDMSTDEICTLGVGRISADCSALYLWATMSHALEDAPRVMRAWGFRPVRIDTVWQKTKESGKPHATCGPWGMTDAEVILLGTRGDICSKQIGTRNQYTIVQAPYEGTHSRKPDIFADRIVERFGDVPRVELFARAPREGWDVIGNEIDGRNIQDVLKGGQSRQLFDAWAEERGIQ